MKVHIGGLALRMDVDKEEMKATIRSCQEETRAAIDNVLSELEGKIAEWSTPWWLQINRTRPFAKSSIRSMGRHNRIERT
jgi:hypothetical protein